ncbi:gamma-glutamyltransferase family protein [Roseateles sp.]|uniref:gamma-glutamyltransferase family protein n=1 Tax=Roseateles sp. TaxID=1971397 RepID=UPI0037C9B30D
MSFADHSLRRPRLCLLALVVTLTACSTPPPVPPSAAPLQPEGASGYQAKPGWQFQRQAVAAANPLATEAGAQILRQGGSAVDAAVAVQMVLTLVEPQSSGIGGGAFLMHWDGQRVQAFDGRETAPAAADEALFLQPDGKPMPFIKAVVGGRSVGVPGAVRMLELAQRQHGRLPWAQLFEPAIQLAEQGFEVSPRLHTLLSTETALKQDKQALAYFFDAEGKPWPVGHRLRNPALAAVLRAIAQRGSAALHEPGTIAADLVGRVQNHAGNPGRLTQADLSGYQALEREALCHVWRARWRICGFPPPSSGHLTLMQMLYLMDAKGMPTQQLAGGVPTAEMLHLYTESARLAFADRAQYIGDPRFVAAPGGRWDSLLDAGYLRSRAALIGEQSMGSAKAGQPGTLRQAWAPQAEQPEYGTSHISVIDAQGRAVALTTSIEAVFGSRLMSDGGSGLPGGYLLNNQLTDFALAPRDAQGVPVANRLEPGKRPRSSMSPTLVFDARDGRLLMSLGSPGGPAIIHFTTKTLLGTLAWGLDAQQAVNLPNFGSFNGPTVLEAGRFPAATVDTLKARAHVVQQIHMPSGLQAIERKSPGWFGGADPRREGVVRGD